MAAAPEHAFAVFASTEDARSAIEALREAGFEAQDISLAMPTAQDIAEAAEGTGHADERVTPVAAVGAVLGGLAGWLVGVAVLAVPGAGPFLAAGAFGTAMAGAGVGVGLGALAGALANMGLSRHSAHWYEQQVHAGNTLVGVRAGPRAEEARQVLRRYGAYQADVAAELPHP